MSNPVQREFSAVVSTVLPMWVAMVAAPRSALTRRLMSASMPLLTALGGAYGGLLVRALVREGFPVNPFDGEGWRRVLASRQGFITGWTHFVVFDLFVGRWIWQTALEEDRGCRLALLLSCFAGPLGLVLFNLQRRLAPR